jgi:putative MATE family efflux protein
MSINVGATAMVARYKGAGDRERANGIVRQSLLLTFFFTIFVSALFFIFSEPIIKFMGAEEGLVLAEATKYLQIQAAGFITLALTATITAVLRGVGNSRSALIYNTVANIVNVFFNWVLIYGKLGAPMLGVAGASLATVIGQAVAMAMAFAGITKKNGYLSLSFKGFKPDWEALGQISSIGFPVMLERIVMRVGMVAYAKMVASLGTVMLATHQICVNVMQLSFVSIEGCQVAVTSLVGQSIGRKRSDMAQAYSVRCRRVGIGLAVATGLLFFFGGRLLISLYLDRGDPHWDVVMASGVAILRILAFYQPFQSTQFILAGVLRGAGDTKATAIIYLITVMIIRPISAAIFIYIFNWGLVGGWLSMGVDQVLRYLLILWRFNSGKWIFAVKMKE